jgi:hypothetical protein
MDCTEAEQQILESFESPLSHVQHAQLVAHIANCPGCRRFHEFQQQIDRRLQTALQPAAASANWRASVRRTIRRDALSAWPDFLPDVAHLAGCGAGVAASFLLLPWHLRTILLAGAAFTVLTFFLQAILRSYVSRPPDI